MPGCSCWNDVFQYETNKVTRIQSVNYGTIKWVLHMIVFSYVSFALVSDKMYQRKEPVISSVHTKVKGVAEVREEVADGTKKAVQRVFDTADYTLPLQGNSFFVMTNYLRTEGQEQRLCPQYPTPRTLCSSDRGCKKGWMDPQSKGIQTGRCVVYSGTKKTCEVSAWCPIEAMEEAPRPALLSSAENFTVLIKNNIDFPGHNYTTRNILPGLNTSCTFHKMKNTQCPIFRLGDIFQDAGDNFSDVAIKGGIMGIEIYWDCNLDGWSHHCRPKYSFRRLDDKTANESLYPGYNFRYAKYYRENNVEKRTLIKVFGIRFDILVFGTTLKYVSFVDEPHIRMVDQQLLGKSLQDVKGQKIPRPPMDFTHLAKLPWPLPDPAPAPGHPEEMQPLRGAGTPGCGDSPGWCHCGNCLASRLPKHHKCLEELCCRRGPGPCITTSELFGSLVLSRPALQQLLLYQEPLLALDEEATNSRLRHCAYRCYAAWRFGSRDAADFGILPSCCRWRIRREFPKSQGQYSGFRRPY
ncbi:P2X purinoceptor 7 isoform X4 [Heterocephalus glaber]|uniref:P2X purinoceptor n=1 Tax=Heterocephalus glaber TaxID=10181 RepID=A0AAX6SVF4_HETGA|nr:P2X purinoceptor 7 isoform X4 [Heterocephalus glaber]